MQTTDPSVPPAGSITFRMSKAEYLKFEKELPAPAVDNNTSQLNAGVKLGVQLVLREFRSRFVEGL